MSAELQSEAVELLQRLIRFDTVNRRATSARRRSSSPGS